MSDKSPSPPLPPRSPLDSNSRRSLSPRSPSRGRSYSPRSTRSSSRSRSYSRSPRSRSRSPSYSSRHRHRGSSRSRSRSPYYKSSRSYHSRSRYYSRSPPPSHHHHSRRSPPPTHSRRYRSRSPPPPPPPRRRIINKDCRVYIGNLPFEVSWYQLKDFMKEAGQVVHVDVLKLPNGRSKGCGVVEYRYPEEAKRAIHIMNKAEFMGRPVFVREDREYENAVGGGLPKDPRDAPEDCKLSVGNLPLKASWQDMKDLFRKAGRVLHTDIHTDPGSRRPNGNGTVIFDDARTARAAIEMFNGYEWQGRRLEVTEGRHIEKSAAARPATDSPSRKSQLPSIIGSTNITSSSSSSRAPENTYPSESTSNYAPPASTSATTNSTSQPPAIEHIPPPPPPPQSHYHQNMYRYGSSDPNIPPPPHLPPPPPPPMYTNMTLVGGPAANLPTHGHNQIFVNNLPFSTTWQDLIDLFRHVGPVLRSEILTINGHPKGSGFVRFEDAATCERAIDKFHGYTYGGRHLDIRLDKYSTTI